MPKSTYLDNAVLSAAVLQTPFTPPALIYVALFTVSPTPAGGGTEVAGAGYGRQTVTFGLASLGQVVSNEGVVFPVATAPWGSLTSFALYDASSGGNLLYFGNLSTSRTVLAGDQVTFPSGQLVLIES